MLLVIFCYKDSNYELSNECYIYAVDMFYILQMWTIE